MGDGIVAGQHYDWVTAFARTLDEHGNPAEAVIYYRDALRLNPYQEDVRERLAALSPEIGRYEHLSDTTPTLKSHDPYWAQEHIVAPLPRCELDKRMEELDRTTIVILRAGEL